jgi:hypothetical protein
MPNHRMHRSAASVQRTELDRGSTVLARGLRGVERQRWR